MRATFPVLLFLIVGVSTAVAQPSTVSQQFDAANAAYEDGRYAQALSAYDSILTSGMVSGALYYNLGNTHVRLGQLGEAIRYYEKARQLHPRNARVLHNLEQARRQAGVYPGRLPPRGLAGVVRGWSPIAIFLAGFLVFSGGLALAVLRMGSGTRSVVRHPIVWGSALVGMLLMGLGCGTSAVQSRVQRAVVVSDKAGVHRAPSSTAPPDTVVSEGTLVEIRAETDRWRRVRLGTGRTGWVPARALGTI